MNVTYPRLGVLAALLLAGPPAGAASAEFGQAGVARVAQPAIVSVAVAQFPGPPPQGRGQPGRRPDGERPGPRRGATEVTEPFSRTLRLAPDGTLDLANFAGDIVITGGGGDEVRVDAMKRAWHDEDAGARALLREARVRVIERGGTIEVRTDGPRRRDWAVEYTVALPARAHVTIWTVSGAVRVTNVTGELRAETASGNIIVASARRVRLLKTFSGDIDVSNVEGQELTAQTVSGNLTGRALRVHTIDVESVSGELRLSDIESSRARIRSINGPIEFRGRLARSGHYELMTHSGSIRVAPAGNVGFDVDASTISGTVRSELTLAERSQPSDRDRTVPGLTRVRGTFGEAGAALSLRSISGDILILER